MSKIIIVGGGAAGMLCSILSADQGNDVILLEHNEKLGKKIYITGKGRCNFTNNCTEQEFLDSVVSNSKFLYSAISDLSSGKLIGLFESWGLKTKTERGKRAFPASDFSGDVIDTLRSKMKKSGVKVRLNTDVTGMIIKDGIAIGVNYRSGEKTGSLYADRVVIATGGLSYPSTGSTGDGYKFARESGHKVTATYPSLVPLVCAEEYVRELQGLSLKNVELHIKNGKKELVSEFGEMMFTHFGITGPIVLRASSIIGPLIGKKPLKTYLDLKPALKEEQLDARFLRLFNENANKAIRNVIPEVYPLRMVPVMLDLAGIDPDKRIHDITRGERVRLIEVTKRFPMTIEALRGYNEAVITKGGVSVKEIDPKTMESKKVPGLYFIGEVLDVDAYTGGFNLQIAWCTAAACAGYHAE